MTKFQLVMAAIALLGFAIFALPKPARAEPACYILPPPNPKPKNSMEPVHRWEPDQRFSA